jgi:ketosteroid isomerase-like protein
MEALTRSHVHEIYEAFAQGRIDSLANAFDENVDFLSHAPADLFPYLGRRRGRGEVLEALKLLHQHLEVLTFFPLSTLVADDAAALTVMVKIKRRDTGRSAEFLAAHFLRFRKRRIVQYCAIVDSLDAVQQMLGIRSDLATRT